MAKRKNDPKAKPVKKKPVSPPPEPVDVPNLSLEDSAPLPDDIFDEPVALAPSPKSEIVSAEPITGHTEPVASPVTVFPGGRKSELVLGDEGTRRRKSEVVLGEPISGVDYGPESPPSKKRVSEVVLGEPISGLKEQDWSGESPPRKRTSEVDLGEHPSQPVSELFSGSRLGEEEGTELIEGSDEYPRAADSGVELPKVTPKKKGKTPAKKKKDADATVAFDEAAEVGEADLTEAMEAADAEEAEEAEEVSEEVLEAEEADETEEAEVEFDDLVDEDGPKKKKTRPGSRRQEAKEAEEAFGLADDTSAVEAEAGDLLDGEETVDADGFIEDEDDGKKKKKKKKGFDDSGEFPSTRRTPLVAPKYGRRWFGGMVLGLLLGAGGVAAVWYLKPDLLEEVIVKSPNHKKDPVVVAMQSMVGEDYDGAVTQLKDSGDHKLVALRGEARLQKYMKSVLANKADVNPADPDLKAASDDINASQDAYRKANLQRILDEKNNKAIANLVDDLKKATGKAALPDIKDFVVASVDAGKTAEDVKDALVEAKQIAKKDDFKIDDFKTYLKDSAAKKNDFDQINKSLKDNGIDDMGLKGVEGMIAVKKDVETKLEAVDKILVDQKIDKKGAMGVQELVVARDTLKTDRDDLDKVVKDSFKVLEDGKIVPAAADPRKELVNAAGVARLKAESPLAIPLTQLGSSLSTLGGDAGDALAKLYERTAAQTQLAFLLSREPFVQSPEQRLDSLVSVLWNRDYKKDADLEQAGKTASWILDKNAASKPESLGKAHLVVGLAARNQGKFDEARQSFAQAVAELDKDKNASEWGKLAQMAQAELTVPGYYYLPRIEQFFGRGLIEADLEMIPQARQSFKLALNEANAALQAMPNQPQILAERGLVTLHDARAQGKGAVAGVADAVRQDAAAAVADQGAKAQGNYLMGVLEEMLGNGDAAEKHFRAAVDLAPEVEKGRYRAALAKLLQRDRPNNPFPDELKPAAEPKVGQGRPPVPVRTSYLHPLSGMIGELAVGQAGAAADDVDDPIQAKRIQESIDIARQMIQSPDRKTQGNGYLILGKALSKQGRKTEALREYAKGLKVLHGSAGGDLLGLLDDHPAFQIPDAFSKPNPYMAEQYYGKGLHYFWARQYGEAETQFKQAVSYYPQDARYQYYLGLSLLAQGGKLRRDNAAYAIEQGARMEASNRPGSTEVNAALERLQGEMRTLLNGYRARALNSIQ